jgi:hypothetical protein
MFGAYTGHLLRKFVRELPWILSVWVVVSIAFVLWRGLHDGLPFAESLKVAIVLLPIVIPIAPIAWLRFDEEARTRRAWPAIGLACVWVVISLPIAVALAVALGSLVSLAFSGKVM